MLREELRKVGRPRPGPLLRHLWRAARLSRWPELRRHALRPGRQRVVVGLTTLPSRIDHLRPTLAALLDQSEPADELVVVLPPRSLREDRDYVVPPWLEAAEAITVLRTPRDEGPASKLLPLLRRERDPDTLLVAVDDDVLYPRDFLQTLLAAHERDPDAALGFRGWDLPPSMDWHETRTLYGPSQESARDVDVLTGTWGLAVRPGFFDDEVHSREGWPSEAFTVDDIWFSGHLAKRGVQRVLVPCSVPPLTRRVAKKSSLSEMENADGEHNNVVIAAFKPWWEASRR